ncbi:HesB/YadR/YfhF family protein [Planococcus sp. ISL-109]|uniref:HesB/YadR/YfhF family protein n=1 Tax=Planococcus sp. ISL-109 TaxID=2819166 RepID=UPI001BE87A4B|nr:HesB/YadR/YfhF family protein [Planococcus sp. ISL-109]MBT2582198.1 HesB/YadR/YfhF family protein [Planococcus sp. ISL-109]
MKIHLSKDAMDWFREEMEVEPGEAVRFFVRYGGSGLQPGFSLGVTKDRPYEATVRHEQDDVLYFIEEADHWYFDEHDLHVTVDDTLDELSYSYGQKEA